MELEKTGVFWGLKVGFMKLNYPTWKDVLYFRLELIERNLKCFSHADAKDVAYIQYMIDTNKILIKEDKLTVTQARNIAEEIEVIQRDMINQMLIRGGL